MRVVVVIPPDPVVTWDEAKAHLRLDSDDERTIVEGMIAAATAHIDGPNGWLGRAIGVQTLEARFDQWHIGHRKRFRLPYPPLLNLVSVRYLDVQEVELSAEVEDFDIFGNEIGPEGSEFVWLGGSMSDDAIRIEYRAGYDVVPAPIKAAILLMVGDLHRFRASASDMNISPTAIPMAATVEAMLQPYRVYG